MDYEPVIGLEVHIQLNTKTKIFCSCSTDFGAPPNTHVCPVCMGQPGVLPVLNEEVLNKSILAGLALNAEIADYSKFDRKNYFYPDLPKGYQVSQFDYPIVGKGSVIIDFPDGTVKTIGVTRAHMEEDAGKLVHVEGTSYSHVDLNRACVPLLEIVSEPDMRSSEEAYLYLRALRNMMKTINVSNVNLEEGSMRCDANVSVRPKGQKKFGTKVEIKNMNSFNGVRKAIDYEIQRQIFAIENSEPIVQETRLFDSAQGKTFPMRSKEEANDYRYFPEPELPPVVVSDKQVEAIRMQMPELPRERKLRFVKEFGLSMQDGETLCDEKDLADYFEESLKGLQADPKKASNWIQSELMAVLNQLSMDIVEFSEKLAPPSHITELLNAVEDGTISGKIAKEVFSIMVDTGKKPSKIIEEKGLKQVSDTGELESVIDKILSDNSAEVERYQGGETKLLGFFVGQVMKETRGKANPKAVNEILRNKLS